MNLVFVILLSVVSSELETGVINEGAILSYVSSGDCIRVSKFDVLNYDSTTRRGRSENLLPTIIFLIRTNPHQTIKLIIDVVLSQPHLQSNQQIPRTR